MFEWWENDWLSVSSFMDWGISIFTSGGYYHLWYLLGLIYALPILSLIINRISSNNGILIIAIILWIIQCLLYTDLFHFYFSSSVNLLIQIIEITVRILSLLMLGRYIRTSEKRKYYKSKLVISFGLLVGEVYVLKNWGCTKFSYVLTTFIVAYYVFVFVRDNNLELLPEQVKKIIRTSDFMYIVHPAIVFLLMRAGQNYGISLFVLTTLITFIIANGVVIWRMK